MNSKPKISVIFSVHNGEAYLGAALQSIINQTFNNFECVVINDCSTDRSIEIITKFQGLDDRIVLFNNATKLGLTKSLNKGLAHARGNYIARMDADDISRENRFERQVAFLEQNPDVFLCATEFDYIDTKNNIIERNVGHALKTSEIESKLGHKNRLLHPTIMFRNDGSRYRDKFYYAQDYDFYLTALTQKKRLVLLPDKLVLYRWDPTAISYRNRSKQGAFAKKAIEFYQQRRTHNQDGYDAFDPNTIIKLPSDTNCEMTHLVDLTTFYLQNGQLKMSRQIFRSYCQMTGKSRLKQTELFLFTTFPWMYRLYRHFRYNDATTD